MLKLLWWEFENKEEFKKFGLLALVFFGIIGIYWTLRPMKDSIFNELIGLKLYQPVAKGLSLIVVSCLVILYGKLIDTFARHKVFYFFIAFYCITALLFYWGFSDQHIGLANKVKDPYRIIGWAWYIWVESFGSLVVALFWAIVTDITSPEAAKRGFPFVALFGQLGNFMGPLVLHAERLGFSGSAPMLLILAGLLLFTGFVFWIFISVIPASHLKGYHQEGQEESEPGFFEGLKLLFTRGYLLGIFLMITFYETIVTVFDYHFKTSAAEIYRTELELNSYLNFYAVMTGLVSTVCVLFGINKIQKIFGMKISLFMTPVFVTVAAVALKLNPSSLTFALCVIVSSKAVNYALNQPTLKQLYIPTSKNTKYKAQAWLEMFGSRGSKGAGSAISNCRSMLEAHYGVIEGLAKFLLLMNVVTFGCVAIWIPVAAYVARTYDKAIKEKRIVC